MSAAERTEPEWMTIALVAWHKPGGELAAIDIRDVHAPGADDHPLGYRGQVIIYERMPIIEPGRAGRSAAQSMAIHQLKARVRKDPALEQIRAFMKAQLAEQRAEKKRPPIPVEVVEDEEWQRIAPIDL